MPTESASPFRVRTTPVRRRIAAVEAVQVLEWNVDRIAEWCGAEAPFLTHRDDPYITVPGSGDNAYLGDWIVFDGKEYSVYSNVEFKQQFDMVYGEDEGFEEAVLDEMVAAYSDAIQHAHGSDSTLEQPYIKALQRDGMRAVRGVLQQRGVLLPAGTATRAFVDVHGVPFSLCDRCGVWANGNFRHKCNPAFVELQARRKSSTPATSAT